MVLVVWVFDELVQGRSIHSHLPLFAAVERDAQLALPLDRRVGAAGLVLDDVEGLGTFIELELLTAESELDTARQCIASLATHLELTQGERRSYLELLLASE